jgi:hypothetical protein
MVRSLARGRMAEPPRPAWHVTKWSPILAAMDDDDRVFVLSGLKTVLETGSPLAGAG